MRELADTELILKAVRLSHQEAEGEHPEAWAVPVEDGFVAGGMRVRTTLADDLAALVGGTIVKAVGPHGAQISREQLDDLKALVRQHYLAAIMPDARKAFWNVPDATRRRWEEWGIIGPRGGPAPIGAQIDEMVVAARVAELLEQGTSFVRMRQMARERPQTRANALAREIARTHGGQALGRLADRHGDSLEQLIFGYHQRVALGGLVAEFLAGRAGQGGRSTTALASEMRRMLGSPAFERDWRRVAVSETRWAFNYGTLVHYAEEGWGRVYYAVQPGACDHCKRLLLHPDGTPRVFALDDIIANLAEGGGMNAGKSAALIGVPGGWVPTALIHPWCRCAPRPYIPEIDKFKRGS